MVRTSHAITKAILFPVCSLFFLLIGNATIASNSRDIGDYIVHYSALPTTSLSAKIAKQYDITRSNNRGMLNVAVIKKAQNEGGKDTPVTAKITAYATNLNSQLKTLEMRELRDQNSVYYIGEFNISDGEALDFTITVSPEQAAPQTIMFKQNFFK